jgi:AAA family ATP:ADP antiporter
MRNFWFVSLSGFFVLAGYNFIRSVSVPVFIEMYGKDRLIESQAVMGLVLIATLYFYNRLLSSIGARRTLLWTQGFFATFFALGTLAAAYKIGPLIYALNVFKEIYIVMIVEQIWSYFNSTYHGPKHKLYVGIMTGVASFGPILSGFGASWIADNWHPYLLFLFTGIFLVPSLILMNMAYLQKPVDEVKHVKNEEKYGLKEFKTYPLLKVLFFFVICSQMIATLGTLNFQMIMAETFPDTAEQTSQYGSFYSYINLYAGILQFLAVPLFFRFLKPQTLVLAVILLNLGLQSFALFYPSFSSIMYASLLFKSVDYSLFRCVKETFYETMSFDARYRSKQLIDVFGYRLAGGLFNTFLGIVKSVLPAIQHSLSLMGTMVAAAWLLSAFGLQVLHHKRKRPK